MVTGFGMLGMPASLGQGLPPGATHRSGKLWGPGQPYWARKISFIQAIESEQVSKLCIFPEGKNISVMSVVKNTSVSYFKENFFLLIVSL